MTETPIPMALLRNVLWQRGSEPCLEYSRLMSFSEGYILDGHVIMLHERMPAMVHYFVHCGHDWSTRNADIQFSRGISSKRVHVRVDEERNWWIDGGGVAELSGVADIDLAFTPATNTLPIRRLALAVGESTASDAAWLRFPELTWERLTQRYTRVGDRHYRYESGGGAFVADLYVDDEGVVVQYGRHWRRIGD